MCLICGRTTRRTHEENHEENPRGEPTRRTCGLRPDGGADWLLQTYEEETRKWRLWPARGQIDHMEGPSGDITVTSSNRKCSAVTGSGRRIKDGAADWHNLRARWEKLNDDGFVIAGNIVNLRLSSHREQQVQAPPAGGAELQEECSKLHDIVNKMVAIVMKMERLTASQRGILDLEEFQFGPEGRKVPLFHSWTTKQFEDSSRVLLDAFRRELQLKQTILQELAHTVTSDLCMVYLSCWLHQPFSPPQTRLTLEALLLETGHRPL